MGHNPSAPAHRSINCRDQNNTHSKYATRQPIQRPFLAPAPYPASFLAPSPHPVSAPFPPAAPGPGAASGRWSLPVTPAGAQALVFHVTDPGGSEGVCHGIMACNPGAQVGLILAANAGRAGGSCGGLHGPDHRKLQIRTHTTQEERVYAAYYLVDPSATCETLLAFHAQYGLVNPSGTDTATKQGLDYTQPLPPRTAYYRAWAATWRANPRLVFFAAVAPNAGMPTGRTASSSMARTYSPLSAANYNLFREGVEWALRSSLELALASGVSFVVAPRVGGGIYAGHWGPRINAEYPAVLAAVCTGRMSDGSTLAPLVGITVVCVTLE
jgi:hypothetical protein